jgi:hypothetical protein
MPALADMIGADSSSAAAATWRCGRFALSLGQHRSAYGVSPVIGAVNDRCALHCSRCFVINAMHSLLVKSGSTYITEVVTISRTAVLSTNTVF